MGAVRVISLIAGALVLCVAAIPSRVAADSPARGQILTAGDHVLPGETLTVTGFQLDPGERLSFRLIIKTTDLDLGTATVAADGSVEIKALVPIGTPVGYGEVAATNASGSTWSTVTLIGERPEGPAASSAPTSSAIDGPVDDRVIGLIMVALGVVLVVLAVAWWWTGRRRKDAPAA